MYAMQFENMHCSVFASRSKYNKYELLKEHWIFYNWYNHEKENIRNRC